MAISNKTKAPSTFKILCEVVKLPTKNCKLVLPILLLSFLTSSLIFSFYYLSITPPLTDLTSKSIGIASVEPKSPEYYELQASILKDLKEFIGILAIYLITSFIISSLLTIATIHVFSLTYSGKQSTVNDLLYKLRRGLKGPMITRLYVMLLSQGYTLLVFILIGVFMVIAHGSVILIAIGVTVALLALLLYLYLVMVWSVSVVISVVEESCYGLEAIAKASETVRGGRRQGVLLMIIELAMSGFAFAAFNLVNIYFPPSTMSWLVIGVVYVAIAAVMNMFALAVSMVFYHVCKGSNGVDMGIDIEGGFIYSSVPTAAVYDDGATP